MLCRKCHSEIDLTQAGMICSSCNYDNEKNPENLPEVDINTTTAFDSSVQMTCPKCGGHNISVNPAVNVENTAYSPMKGLLGMCCCGLPGCLFGLAGDQKLRMDQQKVCNDCGTHFI